MQDLEVRKKFFLSLLIFPPIGLLIRTYDELSLVKEGILTTDMYVLILITIVGTVGYVNAKKKNKQ
ncbi:hypothetical protein F7984_02010 [Pradoshia sp. D12]|uniref:hypothetical protein n=1 Tax=Bacillaceae TaxID=186817 RepID=UPI00112BC5C7|nr:MULTISPECIES: hypothetical protein [Bacillaceae]QFK70120.1 hypothetical protein F7984_02010 [Pradoshia sp. D12]TPF70899.1 hypothetical protein FHY44_14180 [Bacillus sp. D12]